MLSVFKKGGNMYYAKHLDWIAEKFGIAGNFEDVHVMDNNVISLSQLANMGLTQAHPNRCSNPFSLWYW